MERNRKKQKERGITLVALIITIIVMLILVAVTVRVVVESDIIGTAEKTAKAKETGELKDQVAMKIGEWQLGRYVEETKNKTLIEYLNELKNDEAGIEVAGTAKIGVITKGDTTITVNEAGEMTIGQVDIWDGESKEIPEVKEDGNIYIHNAKQFKYFADSVNGKLEEDETALTIGNDTVVYLMTNLDLGARVGADGEWGTPDDTVVTWTPIGPTKEEGSKFTGTFDGKGHVISGVYVSVDGNFGGIFGNSDTIQNLTVKDSYIKLTGCGAGAIVGALREGEIINCHNINTEVFGGGYSIGGITGQFTGTRIATCSNSGNITSIGALISGSGTSSIISYIGGIGGDAAGTIEDCYNSGTITGKGITVGGIIGYNGDSDVIKKCVNNGTVIGESGRVGGISGELGDGVKVIECKNAGNISGELSVGGIAGIAFGTIEKSYNEGDVTGTTNNIGGICGGIGANAITIIENTYNKGTVIAEGSVTEFVGGIVGLVGDNATSVVIKNNYNVGTITIQGTGTTDIGGAIGHIEIAEDVREAYRNYYLDTVVTERGSNTSGDSRDVEHMKSQAFVDELNTGLTEKAWVKTNEYPALIGM